jgi:hypothetical protein
MIASSLWIYSIFFQGKIYQSPEKDKMIDTWWLLENFANFVFVVMD